MKVRSYKVHNVLAVRDVDFNLEGHHLFLVGGANGHGKSSALNALVMALAGRRGMDNWPEVALREGEQEGWVQVDLTGEDELQDAKGFTAELYLRRKRDGSVVEEFRLIDSTGEEAPEPRTLLRSLFDLKAFDPLAFQRLDKAKKREVLMKLVGLDFAELNKERKRLYDERTIVNREGQRQRSVYDSMPCYEGVPEAEVAASSLLAELERRESVNAHNWAQRQNLTNIGKQITESRAELAKVEEEIARLQQRKAELDDRLAKLDAHLSEQSQVVGRLKDEDTDEIRRQIANVDELNAKIRSNQQREAARVKLEDLRRQSQELSAKINDIDERQKVMLANAKWPVPGLGIDDEGVTYNGLPIEQASSSQNAHISIRIGMALNPKLRLLVCQAGSEMDNATLDEIDRIAKEEDFQIIMEIVTRSKEDEERCAVIMRNGRSITPEDEGQVSG